MNQTPIPQKNIPPRRQDENNQTVFRETKTGGGISDRAYWFALLISASSFVLAVLLILTAFINPSKAPAETTDETSDPSESEPSASVAVTYPTSPSRDSYLLSGSGDTIDGSTLSADFAILVSLSDYSVVASLDADARIYPASMTKIMTLIVACETIKDASVILTVSEEVMEYCRDNDATVLASDPLDRFTATDMLYGVGVVSAADACITLANHIAGSEVEFVKLMNAKAASLGLTKTNFANSTGLDDKNNYSTAREMATILAYALDNPFCREILSTDNRTVLGYYDMDGEEKTYNRQLYNTLWNRLSDAGYEKKIPVKLSCGMTLLGAKTGYTDEGGYCLASFLEDESGKLYVTVTAMGEKVGTSITDMEKILNKHG